MKNTLLGRQDNDKEKEINDAIQPIPRGREEVKKAVLDAAEKLLMERNPNEISMREIAQLANVKHPLIHRHFGTKDELIRAVQIRSLGNVKNVVEKIDNLDGNIGAFFAAVEKNKFRQILLARAMIDGVDPQLLQNQFQVMHRFLELIEKQRTNLQIEGKFDARIVAATLTATAMGWILYEPFLLASSGLDSENKDDVKKAVVEILEEIMKKIYET